MSDRKKILALLAGLVLVAVALLVVLRPRQGDASANVAEFAKSIDDTKGNTPSVPPEKLALGRTGLRKSGR